MGRNSVFNHILLLTAFVGSAVFHSCKDDAFNPEKVKATYQDKFPVKDIDPSMDWKMTHQVSVQISVFEDLLTNYTIRIYDANPLIENSNARMLAEGIANSTQSFNTIIDCPTIINSVFVCRTDAHNRNTVKYVSIDNNQIEVTFGNSAKTRFTRAEVSNDVKIESYTPAISLDKVNEMLANAEELSPSTKFVAGDIYKISKGEEYTAPLKGDGVWGESRATLIVCGKWQPNEDNMAIPAGTNIYVMDGGEIVVPKAQTMSFGQSGYLGVFPGGIISGESDDSSITLPASSGSDKYIYNAGTIKEINLSTADNGTTTIYNCGKMEVKLLQCLHLINQGHIECKEIKSVTGVNLTIDNGCYLDAGKTNGDLNCGYGSRTKIDEFNMDRSGWGTKTQIGSNALLQITKGSFTGSFYAPSSSDGTLVRIENVNDISNFSSKGKIYYEIKDALSLDGEDDRNQFVELLKNTDGSYSKWGESPIIIPSGDCTGDGYTPEDTGSVVPSNPISYTYVFEDNFPLVGDYDFNDVVLDVVTTYYRNNKDNQIKQMRLDVTLTALGATKLLGAGLRLVNISKSAIQSITPSGDYANFHRTLTTSDNLFKFNASNYMEDGDNNVVIPLFGNAHKVFDGVEQGKMINTDPSGTTSTPKTYSIIIELTDQTQTDPIISKNNLDFFICYRYKSMQERVEVHLYEFWEYKATAAGSMTFAENLELAGNNTWAICAPYFRYPIEHINISNQKEQSDCAYPAFLDWARKRTPETENWYLSPIGKNVYR